MDLVLDAFLVGVALVLPFFSDALADAGDAVGAATFLPPIGLLPCDSCVLHLPLRPVTPATPGVAASDSTSDASAASVQLTSLTCHIQSSKFKTTRATIFNDPNHLESGVGVLRREKSGSSAAGVHQISRSRRRRCVLNAGRRVNSAA